ncbi:MOP flippase family protein [Niabella beijingensis]|uniref:MOP flippase family protein n=1 Tax=Niabella beijingensis TaxID=2872700 RepID=UPI001CC16366|nr:MOP flippase family protein [Niabella beijingensis]MBZ4191520.1 MOP flippase family protein [Niabella beijingensis]
MKKQVMKGLKWTTISSIILAVVAILRVSILTRFLSKDMFGIIAILTFIINFLELFNDMGISTAILHKQEMNKKEYSSLYWLNLIFSSALYALLLLLSPLIVKFYNLEILKELIPITGLIILFNGLGRQFKVVEQKNLNFKIVSFTEIFSAICSITLAIVLAYFNFGIYALVLSTVLQYFVSNFIYIFIGFAKKRLPTFYFNYTITKPFINVGMYQVGGQIANYFNRDLDILIIGKLFSTDILGGYSLAKQLVFRPFQFINPIVMKVAGPVLAKMQDNKDLLKHNYLKLLNSISTVNVTVYVGIIVFAHFVVGILYGNGYDNITILVRVLSVYMIFRAIGNPVGSLVVATGRTDLEFKWNLFTLFITPLSVYIGSFWGTIGICTSLTITQILLYVPSWWFLIKRLTTITLTEYIKASFRINFNFKI